MRVTMRTSPDLGTVRDCLHYSLEMSKFDAGGDWESASVKLAREAAWAAQNALYRAEPTTVLGVIALLEALAKNDDGESSIERAINADNGGKVNDFLRQLAAVLREAS
jgi:hypothetical protein